MLFVSCVPSFLSLCSPRHALLTRPRAIRSATAVFNSLQNYLTTSLTRQVYARSPASGPSLSLPPPLPRATRRTSADPRSAARAQSTRSRRACLACGRSRRRACASTRRTTSASSRAFRLPALVRREARCGLLTLPSSSPPSPPPLARPFLLALALPPLPSSSIQRRTLDPSQRVRPRPRDVRHRAVALWLRGARVPHRRAPGTRRALGRLECVVCPRSSLSLLPSRAETSKRTDANLGMGAQRRRSCGCGSVRPLSPSPSPSPSLSCSLPLALREQH